MVPVPSGLVDADSPTEAGRLTPDDPLDRLGPWLADGQVDAAASERARRRWLERQAAEDATLGGVLLDLAERRRPVTLRTRAGTVVRGVCVAVAADFVVVRSDGGVDVLVPVVAIATVRSAPGDPPPVGDRPVALVVTLTDALVELAAGRPTVVAAVAGEETRGVLHRAGRDVIAIESGERRDVVTFAVDALDHLTIVGP